MRPNNTLNAGFVGIMDTMHMNVLTMWPLEEQKAKLLKRGKKKPKKRNK